MKRCGKQDQIEAYLLGELSEADECAFEAHCRQCKSCAAQVAETGQAVVDMDCPDDPQSLELCFAAVQQEIRSSKTVLFQPAAKKTVRTWLRIAAAWVVISGAGLLLFARQPTGVKVTINWQQDGNLVTIDNDQPVVRDGKVFTLRTEQGENQLLALSKTDGALIWKTPIGQTTRIVADEQRIFIGQFSGKLFSIAALSIRDGSKEWSCDHEFNGKRPQRVKFQLASGRLNWLAEQTLYSFDTDQGALLWKTKLSEEHEAYAMPVDQHDSLLVVGTRNLYTIDPTDGSILRVQPHAERFNPYLKPRVETNGERVFVSATPRKGKGRIICYDRSSGRRLWVRETEQIKNIQSVQDLLIVKNDKLEAYDQADGSRVWSEPIGGCYKVAFHDHNIFAIHNTGQSELIALNAKTGERIKSFSISGQSCSGVLIDGQDGFLTTNEGRLIAMKF